MDSEIRREIILENYQNPFHKGLVDEEGYIRVNTNSESCIDNIDMMVKIVDDKIVDIYFDGEACAISTSATSLMIQMFLGKTKMEVLEIMSEYENMIHEREYDENLLGELIVYNEVYKQPNRKKCALLPFESMRKVLRQYENE